jgi:hypothetical protein
MVVMALSVEVEVLVRVDQYILQQIPLRLDPHWLPHRVEHAALTHLPTAVVAVEVVVMDVFALSTTAHLEQQPLLQAHYSIKVCTERSSLALLKMRELIWLSTT